MDKNNEKMQPSAHCFREYNYNFEALIYYKKIRAQALNEDNKDSLDDQPNQYQDNKFEINERRSYTNKQFQKD